MNTSIMEKYPILRHEATLGGLLAAGSVLGTLALLYGPGTALAILGAVAALALIAWGVSHPFILLAVLWLTALFNVSMPVGQASIKLTELVAAAMLAVALMRLAARDPRLWQRLRQNALPIGFITLLGVAAVLTARPHPNFFNVRYELEQYLVFIFAALFFERRHWPALLATLFVCLLLESLAALGLRFGFGLAGLSLHETGGGILPIKFDAQDFKELGGGTYRLAGTLGHKNMLAALIILALPPLALEWVRGFKPVWLVALLPALLVLVLTDSVTGWGALACIGLLALLHLRRFDLLAVMMLVALPLGMLVLVKYGATIFHRLEQLAPGQEGYGTVSSRFKTFALSMEVLREHGGLGIGRNNFSLYANTWYQHAHSMYLMKLLELGWPAGLMFLGFLAAIMLRAWRAILFQAKALSAQGQYYRFLGLWLGCLGFLAMNFFDYQYGHFSMGPLFMGMLGIITGLLTDMKDA